MLAVALVAIVPAACGGDDGREVGDERDDRAALELRLAKTSVGICNGGCKTYSASAARCTGSGREIRERTYYRCRVVYGEGRAGRADTFCAALDEARGYVVLPRENC